MCTYSCRVHIIYVKANKHRERGRKIGFDLLLGVTSVLGGMKILNQRGNSSETFLFYVFQSFFLSHFHSPEWFVWRQWRNAFPPRPTSTCFSTYFPIFFLLFYFFKTIPRFGRWVTHLSLRVSVFVSGVVLCKICGEILGIGTGFAASTSVFPSHCRFSSAVY